MREVYRAYGRLVYAVAYQVLGERGLAEEATQQTFMQAWRAASSYDPARELGPWLATIARRTAIDIHRREARQRHDALDDVNPAHPALMPGAGRSRRRPRRRLLAAVAGAVAAAAVVAAIAIGVSLSGGPAPLQYRAALAGTSLAPRAAGQVTLTRTTSGWRVTLTGTGLPRLDNGQYYEAWLKNPAGVLVPIGTFNQPASVTLWSGVSPQQFPAITITRQRADGNPASSGQRVLTGEARPA